MQIDLIFKSGIFEVLIDGTSKVHQPFIPSPTGLQIPWDNELQALQWWNTIKHSIVPTEIIGE